MKNIIIQLMSLSTLLCMNTACDLIDTRHPSTKAVHKIIKEFRNEMEEKYPLRIASISEAGTKETYTHIGIAFQINQTLSKDQGRALLVECLEAFIEKLNSSKSIEKYLDPYPFSYDHVSVSILPMGVDRRGLVSPDISIFQYGHGKVWFYKFNPENPNRTIDDEKETYEETVRKAQEYLKTHDLQAELSR